MIWFIIFSPIIILGIIAFYFDKKHGAVALDESTKNEKLREYPPEHNGINGPGPNF